MRKSLQLRQRRTTLATDARALLDAAEGENRELTAEERTRFDGLHTQITTLGEDIAREERQETLEASLATPVGGGAEARNIGGAARGGSGRPEDGRTGEFRNFGEFLFSVRFKPNDARLGDPLEIVGGEREDREMSMGTDAAGGYAVPRQFHDGLLEVQPQEAIVRPRATLIPAGDNPDAPIDMVALDQSAGSNMYGGVVVNWIGEGDAVPETDARIKPISMIAQEMAGYITLSDKLLRNWSASGTVTERLLRGASIAAEDVAEMTGNGVAKPLGILHANNTAALTIPRTTANRIVYADIVAMFARAKFGGKLEWLCSQMALSELMDLKDNSGRLIWQPNASEGSPGTLLGLPVRLNERSPGLGSRGDLALIDYGYYLVKDGFGPVVAASPHVKFLNNKTVVKIVRAVDAKPWLNAPIRTEGGYDISPFVILGVPQP